jgi:hypothetical protein
MKWRLLHLLLLSAITVSAQNWTWDTLGANWGGSICKDHAGGYFEWEPYGYKVKRITGSGAQLWQQSFSGSNIRIRGAASAIDSSYYVSGSFSDSLLIAGSTLYSNGNDDIFIARFSPSGTLLWIYNIGTPGYESAGELCVYPGGRILLTGQASGPINFLGQSLLNDTMPQYFVARITDQGTLQSIKFATSGNTSANGYGSSSGSCLATDPQGNIFSSLIKDGPPVSIDTVSVVPSYAMHIVKMDSSLAVQWVRVLPSFNYYQSGWLSKLACNAQGELHVLEHSAWHYNGGSVFSRYSPAGTLQYSIAPSNIVAPSFTQSLYSYYHFFYAFDLDSCDNIYMLGSLDVAFTGGNQYRSDEYVFRLSPTFQTDWIKRDSSANYFGWPLWGSGGISVTSPNNCFITGMFTNSVTLYDTLYALPVQPLSSFYAKFSAIMSSPVNVTPAQSQMACFGKSVTLSASAAGHLHWYPTSTSTVALASGPSFTTAVLPAGNYTYFADASTCTTTTGRTPVTFTIAPLPLITVNNGTLCNGRSFTFTPTGALSYTFPLFNTNVVVPTSNTVYIIPGIDANGCIGTGNSSVTVIPLPNINILCLNRVCAGQVQTLQGSGALTYTWSSGVNTSSVNVAPMSTTAYTLTGTGSNSCINSMAVTVSVEVCGDVGSKRSEIDLLVFPNPAQYNVYVKLNRYAQLEIYNVTG